MSSIGTSYYGLRHVAGDPIYIGVVQSVDSASSIDFVLEKLVGPPPVSEEFREGATVSLSIFQRRFEAPYHIPTERLRGAVKPTPGDRVIAIPCNRGDSLVELLPVTEARLRVISLLWDRSKMAAWLAAPDSELVPDLADADLARLVAARLEKAGTLTAERLLGAEEEFLFEHFREMKPDRKARFLREAAALATADSSLQDRVFRLATEDPRPEWIGVVAPLMAQVDPTTETGKAQFSHLYYQLQSVARGVRDRRFPGPLDLSPFADFLIAFEKHRPTHLSSDAGLWNLTDFIEPRAKAAMAVGFLESARSSTFAGDGCGAFLLRQAARLATEAPSASILEAVSKLSPGATTNHTYVLDPLLQIGGAVFRALPAERARVRTLLNPWIDLETPPSSEALAGYVDILGEADPGSRQLPPGLLGFFEGARLAESAPAPWLVDAVLQLNPQAQSSYHRQMVAMDVLLDTCSRLVTALPEQRARVQEIIQPLIEATRTSSGKGFRRYMEVVGVPPKGEPEAGTFELTVGDVKRLSTGLTLRYEVREDGWFKATFTLERKGVGWGLNPAKASYREAWVAPYIVTAHRTESSGDRIRITAIPQTVKPEHLQDSEGYDTAKALAAKAGCPDHEEHESRPSDGCFEYRATGPGGKSCTILIGTLTRRVISTT